MYRIDQQVFDNNFISKSSTFLHRPNKLFNMFPFTTTYNQDDSLDNILGAFLRMIYSLKPPKEINRDTIISNICKEVDCTPQDKVALKAIIKDLYFLDEHTLRCTKLNMFMYNNTSSSKNNEQKLSEYLVGAICDSDKVKQALVNSQTKNNLLDTLIMDFLPQLESMCNKVDYIALIPDTKFNFTKDLVFLIKNRNTDYNDIILLISYYYFFYTSQVIMYINKFCKGTPEITPIFFCTEWEKTSVTRECFTLGWKTIEAKLKTMFPHAILLEMLNQTQDSNKYTYHDIWEEYNNATDEEKMQIWSQVENLKTQYTTNYIKQDGFTFQKNNYESGNIDSLIRGFFDDIILQFEKGTSRSGTPGKYSKTFSAFCKNNFLKRFGRCGNMLALSEELLILMTKIVIEGKKQMRLNELFDAFRKRGIYLDKQSQKSVVEFYEKLNLIEKKSDSGDAQYVKGIL